ncbi:B-box zinc finger protein [Pyxidicoccus xibeiensis]|uniref:hypothetical protein n=1 Tax=Pyxidicoccus xibeiensis TaxID=2906759 RepID=UPI0020A7F352|nr:hypothetical protein [Pyxidicoccus xibeiensis]MCP3136561.1 hypothetical protein [Pyxidicoccus xibeiensis]
MSEMGFGPETGASCPRHQGLAAVATCERCGNFMCRTCSRGGSEATCPSCRERTGQEVAFPLSRDNWSIGGLVETCWEAFKREWVMITVGVLIVAGASIVGQIASQIISLIGGAVDSVAVTLVAAVVGYLVATVIQGVVTIGFFRMLFDVLNGQKADLARVFTQFHKTVPYLLTSLLTIAMVLPFAFVVIGAALAVAAATGGLEALQGVDWTALGDAEAGDAAFEGLSALGPSLGAMVFVATALYIFPGLWLMMPLVLVQPELAKQDNPTPMETLRRCFAYARGQRLSMLGTTLLGGLFVVAGFMACCVGFLPAAGLVQVLMAGLYLTLSNGADQA